MVEKTLKVNLESYLYLQEQCKLQRLGEKLTDKQIERYTRDFNRMYPNGKDLFNGSICNWTIKDMEGLLKKVGLQYEESEVDIISGIGLPF